MEEGKGYSHTDNTLFLFSSFYRFLSRDSSTLICWCSTYIHGTSEARMCRGLPTVHFRFSFVMAVVGFEPQAPLSSGRSLFTV